ncbi:hypothetical protein, partial [Streptococcus pseudopneumoniae]|uniref:hypothetical protein n=1 Tax=Streptococcus pseudopneumoniae TaxID=257758 RepID=UPI0019D629C0
MMLGGVIGMVMPEYSTPYYGTSGFGTNQTTYPLCPYQDIQLTWKGGLFDETATISAFPNLRWYLGFSNNGGTDSLFIT